MAFTAGLTSGLTEPITKTLLEDYFYGKLTLEQMVAALGSTLWLDATETYAKSKVAVDLDGTNDYFSIADADAGDFAFDKENAFSVSGWFNADNIATAQFIIAKKETGTPFIGWGIDINSSKLRFSLQANGSLLRVESSALSSGTWYHFTCTYNGSESASGATIYINGVSDTSIVADTLAGTILNSVDFNIGARGTTNKFAGKIDQLIPFSKALTSTEASTLYNSGDGLHHKDLDGTESFYGNIVAWYDFNTPPNFGRNYAEESHAVRLSSASDKLTSSSTDFNKQPSDAFSWGYWLKVDSIVGMFPFFFQKDNGVTGYEIYFDGSISSIDVDFKDDAGGRVRHSYSSVFTAGQWVHFVVTYSGNGQSSGLKLYLNGVEQTPVVNNNVTMTGSFDNSNDFTLFIGDIDTTVDEAFFYSDELISGEVTTLYNGGTVAPARTLHTDNLVSDWSFNAQNVTDIGKDSYGSNDLTPVSIVEADLVGGKDSLDLTEVSIDSSNAVLGHIEGKAAGYDGVTKWLDRSGNGNDVSQSTLADCPYFDTATNSIIFTGTQNLVTLGNIGLTGDFTIFEVKAYSDVTEVVDTVGINGNLIRNIGSGSERNVWSATPNNNSTTLVNNTFAITAQHLEDGVSGNFWTNGVKDDAFSDTTMVRTDGPLKINQDTGIVGELRYKAVLYWNRKLTDSEMATVFEYLNDLYGVY